ncbi:MAG: hypothetical protein M1282_01140 [Chloroflexi bacterium]|nr:hypothetical protein [Chloroflexota bacterium]
MRTIFWLITMALMVSSQGCAFRLTTPVSVQALPSSQTETIPTASLQTDIPAPTIQAEIASPTATAALTPPVVTITAVNGNLFIRRGPDLAYNAVSALMKDQVAMALGRDVLARWAQIPIPGQPNKTGWVSIQTQYSAVSGDVMTLPEVTNVPRPIASYFRNCSNHKMLVEPGDTVLLSVSGYPDNIQWINPGIYTVYDYDLPTQPEVLSAELREGLTIDILVDGSGEHKKCPDTMIKP